MRPERLVEVIVDKIGGTHRGSGYRITTTTVLTAWHVVDGATRLEVRFDSGLPTARTVIAETLGGDPESDLALLSFAATDRIDPEPPARLTGAGADVEVRIAGFPRWKLRGGKYRAPRLNLGRPPCWRTGGRAHCRSPWRRPPTTRTPGRPDALGGHIRWPGVRA